MRGLTYDLKILTLMWSKMKYFENHYIYPSQLTFGKWLCNQGALERSRRTLNRYLRAMQNRTQLSRIRRIRHDAKKGLVFQTTLYALSYLGLLLLYYNGVITWPELDAYMKNSRPFKAREPKKEKKGLSPGDAGCFDDYTSYGGPMKAPG